MATHSSILAWKVPWTEEPDELQSMGLQKSNMTMTEHTIGMKRRLTEVLICICLVIIMLRIFSYPYSPFVDFLWRNGHSNHLCIFKLVYMSVLVC